MTTVGRIEDRIAENYADLSAKLKAAADYVVANQVDVAARSLRSISAASGVSPATLSRLARTLDFENYEGMREMCRGAVVLKGISFSERADQLKREPDAGRSIFERQAAACATNIQQFGDSLDPARLQAAVDVLARARNVVLFGAFGSTGIVEYMAYQANYFATNWTLAGRMGASLGATLAAIGPDDVLVIVTKNPYAKQAVKAAEAAQEMDAQTIVITDSHVCPANKFANFSFIVPSESPQFFSSYTATLVLMETMIAMLVAQSGEGVSDRIRAVETRNKSLGYFWAE